MKRPFALAAALLVAALAVVGCTHRPPDRTDSGWITLLDGTWEGSWANWDRVGDANWRRENGVIMADKKAGKDSVYLVSKNSYSDFQLRVEFWVSEDANSGIFMRCSDPKNIADTKCYEANIFDKSSRPQYSTGAIVNFAVVWPMVKAGGKWNTYEITAKGSQISVWLNGNLTVDLQHSEFASGPIALQYGQGVVKFRKVQIKPIT